MRVLAPPTSLFKQPIARLTRPIVSQTSIAARYSINSKHRTLVSKQRFTRQQVATMSSESTQSQACCNTPAVVSKGYTPKGDYIEVDGLKTCTLHTSSPQRTHTHIHTYIHTHLYIPNTPHRRHRPEIRQTRHPRHLRHLRLLPPDAARRRHSRAHRRRQVPGLHARLLRGQAGGYFVVPAGQ